MLTLQISDTFGHFALYVIVVCTLFKKCTSWNMLKRKSGRSSETDVEKVDELHKRKLKRKRDDVMSASDSLCSNNDDDVVKTKPAKTSQQAEGTTLMSCDEKSCRKDKQHKKRKKFRDESDAAAEQIVRQNSSDCEWRSEENGEQTPLTFAAVDSDGKIAKTKESLNETVKKTGKKKQKMRHDVSVDAVTPSIAASDDVSMKICRHSAKKKKKVRRDALVDETEGVATENKDGSAQYHALEYLRTWKSAPGDWSFQKVRQVWLLQNMYDETKVIARCLYEDRFLVLQVIQLAEL